MDKKILVTGGTGKTGRRVVEQLQLRGAKPHIGTRTPRADDQVRFDWKDSTVFKSAFESIEAVYLVAPTDEFDSLGAMKDGLDAAINAGVQRFVLLSASLLDEGGPMMGEVHAWLSSNAPEWAVLRPSWFMQNFSENQHLAPIRDEAAIYTATQDGRVGFIDAEDIAACATALLLAPEIESTDHILTGPEAVSYDTVAATMSRYLGKKVTHKRLSVQELAERFQSLGLPDGYANVLADMDDSVAKGEEDRTTESVYNIIGRPANSIDAFVGRNVSAWRS